MTPVPDETQTWSPLKWVIIIVIIFGLQTGLFAWLGGRKPASAPTPRHGVEVQIPADPSAEIPGVNDPMLLVTPSVLGFSHAWMEFEQKARQPGEWTGQSNAQLDRPIKTLGGEISSLVASNGLIARVSVVDRPRPVTDLAPLALDNDVVAESVLTIQGDLAARALVSVPKLLPQYSNVPLSNSIVQIDADENGNIFNPPVIVPGGASGSELTDQYALEVARSGLIFKPVSRTGRNHSPASVPRLTGGTVVFQWRTLAPPVTNEPTNQ